MILQKIKMEYFNSLLQHKVLLKENFVDGEITSQF
jgi:hypothetical protein